MAVAAPSAKPLTTQASVNAAVKQICDILRRSGRSGALQYVPELTWLLFLRILDEREAREALEASVTGDSFESSMDEPYRWRDWGAPDGEKRRELTGQGGAPARLGGFMAFINTDLLPHLRGLSSAGSARQRVVAQIMSGVERTGIDTEQNLLEVLDRVNSISADRIDTTHVFPISQVFEGLLLEMGEKNNDGGQFFTPREVIRVMVEAIDPKVGDTLYDPCCGTGGFLVEGVEHIRRRLGDVATADDLLSLKRSTVYGREKDDVIYPIALANLVLHGIDEPHIWHGNTLTGDAVYDGLFEDAPAKFSVVLTNPPFGGKENKQAQSHFAYKTNATQVLFLQHVIDSLKEGGRCAVVVDEGVMFKGDTGFLKTKRKLLDECNLWAVLSLPGGVFSSAGAGVKTSVLFFTKGERTDRVWFYDVSDVKVGKTKPMTRESLAEFLRLLGTQGESERSWTVDRSVLDANNLNLTVSNPNRPAAAESEGVATLIEGIVADYTRIGKVIDELAGALAGSRSAD